MLYQLGSVTIDVFPFNAHEVDAEGATEFAKKEILGRLPGREFTGPGDEVLSLRGQILPRKIGGLSALEKLQEMRRSGERFVVMRGDGKNLDWHVLERVHEGHQMLGPDGVGQVIAHELQLARVDAPAADHGAALYQDLLGLFGL